MEKKLYFILFFILILLKFNNCQADCSNCNNINNNELCSDCEYCYWFKIDSKNEMCLPCQKNENEESGNDGDKIC
jgi:hypothetical protein